MKKLGSLDFSVIFIFVITCLSFHFSHITASEKCVSPDNESGLCVPMKNCPHLLSLLQRPHRSLSLTMHLANSHCGRSQEGPLVCCPERREQKPCAAPNNRPGTCVPLHDCSCLNGQKSELIDEQINLRQASCNSTDNNSICCENDEQTTIPDSEDMERDSNASVHARYGKNLIKQESHTINFKPDSVLPSLNECGIESSEDRIFGGTETNLEQYPWMALVEYKSTDNSVSMGCGGSLISKRYVLTAGHCVAGEVLEVLGAPESVRFGEHDIRTSKDCVKLYGREVCNDKPVVIGIETFIAHPQYRPSSAEQKNDIALIRLKFDAPYTDYVRPICLPKYDVTLNDDSSKIFKIAGWGATENSRYSSVKLQLSLNIVALEACQVAYNDPQLNITLWEKQVCAGGEKGKDSCSGDSGGPLMSFDDLHWTQHGVVSYGPMPCAQKDIPGVYTKLFDYMDWIKHNLKP